ncbi:MAG: hypothetical protein FWE96_07045 [Coriobacteriia bacterium]|nr:hypothetical protein [Coriobacteriia bacterium]
MDKGNGAGVEQRDGVSVPIWSSDQIGTLTPSLCSTPFVHAERQSDRCWFVTDKTTVTQYHM